MDLGTVIQMEVSQRRKKKLYFSIYVESEEMVDMVLFAKWKWRHRGREPTCEYQEGKGEEWEELEDIVHRHTLLCIK